MNIDGFGTETVDRLLENNMIKNFSDIYYLTKEKICSLERMGEKSAINLIDSIINSKNQPFTKYCTLWVLDMLERQCQKNMQRS